MNTCDIAIYAAAITLSSCIQHWVHRNLVILIRIFNHSYMFRPKYAMHHWVGHIKRSTNCMVRIVIPTTMESINGMKHLQQNNGIDQPLTINLPLDFLNIINPKLSNAVLICTHYYHSSSFQLFLSLLSPTLSPNYLQLYQISCLRHA